MKVGTLVTLKEFPSWGVCVITKIQTRGTEETYMVRREGTEGITLLTQVTRNQLSIIEENDENR